MKYKTQKRKGSGPRGSRKGNKASITRDSFFDGESKKRRKMDYHDEDIESGDSEEENEMLPGSGGSDGEEGEENDEYAAETAGEKRIRLAKDHLLKLGEFVRRKREDIEEAAGEGRESDNAGERDSPVARILQQEQLEESGAC